MFHMNEIGLSIIINNFESRSGIRYKHFREFYRNN